MQGYNFTERVRRVLARAREEANALHHPYVGTEHVLLGLLGDNDGVSVDLLLRYATAASVTKHFASVADAPAFLQSR